MQRAGSNTLKPLQQGAEAHAIMLQYLYTKLLSAKNLHTLDTRRQLQLDNPIGFQLGPQISPVLFFDTD